MSKKGFTMVELIVVLAILGILVCIAVPFVNGYIYDSRLSADKAVALDLQNAVDTWMHIERSQSTDTVSYSYLGVTDKIGTMSEYQYYNKYAGADQLPGTEFNTEKDIRRAVLSAMKSVMGNKLIINSDWTIESPKAGMLLSYRYYYRLGLVKVVEYNKKETNDDSLESYYITLDRLGYCNIANDTFTKVDDTDSDSAGIIDKSKTLSGLDISKTGITEGTVEIRNIGTNMKTTSNAEDIKNTEIFEDGIYYIEGKYGNTNKDVKLLLVIDEKGGKCYSFENYEKCDLNYIKKVKNEINRNKNKELEKSEIQDFLNSDVTEGGKKLLTSVKATESEIKYIDGVYTIEYNGKNMSDDPVITDGIPSSLGWHIVGDIEYVEDSGQQFENTPHKKELDNGLKVYFYGNTYRPRLDSTGIMVSWIYDWESDIFEVKNATICLELDSTNRTIQEGIGNNNGTGSSNKDPDFGVDIIAVDNKGNETLYATVLNKGEVYYSTLRESYNTRTTGVVVLKDGKYLLRTHNVQAWQAWLNVYFGKTTNSTVLPSQLLAKGELKQTDGLINFTIDTPTIIRYNYKDWTKEWYNHDRDLVGKITETMVLYRDGKALINSEPKAKAYDLVLMPGNYQIGIVQTKSGLTNDSYNSESTAKISGIKETIPSDVLFSVTNRGTKDEGYGGGYLAY